MTSTHAYNSFAKYCETTATRQADRECARTLRSVSQLFKALRGDWNLSLFERLECPDSSAGFQGIEIKTDLERWLNSPGCRITERAWRRFVAHQGMGLSAEKVAEAFNTTPGVITTNTCRVWAHLENAGFMIKEAQESRNPED